VLNPEGGQQQGKPEYELLQQQDIFYNFKQHELLILNHLMQLI
jgi:hypothetical protein